MSGHIASPSRKLAYKLAVRDVLHIKLLLQALWDIDTESLQPSSISVNAGLQSAIEKLLRIDLVYPG